MMSFGQRQHLIAFKKENKTTDREITNRRLGDISSSHHTLLQLGYLALRLVLLGHKLGLQCLVLCLPIVWARGEERGKERKGRDLQNEIHSEDTKAKDQH
jgi:hypothetical protein